MYSEILLFEYQLSVSDTLKTESFHDANFVLSDGGTSWRYENLSYHLWQSWHHGDSPFFDLRNALVENI